MYSDGNFQAFFEVVAQALLVAREESEKHPRSCKAESTVVTNAGLAICVTFPVHEDGSRVLHLSMSQPGRRTTHAVCSRFGFFAAAMLGSNQTEFISYFTESGVHYIAFKLAALRIHRFESAYDAYLKQYRSIPFEYLGTEEIEALSWGED
jgi:hypothetical protein